MNGKETVEAFEISATDANIERLQTSFLSKAQQAAAENQRFHPNITIMSGSENGSNSLEELLILRVKLTKDLISNISSREKFNIVFKNDSQVIGEIMLFSWQLLQYVENLDLIINACKQGCNLAEVNEFANAYRFVQESKKNGPSPVVLGDSEI